MLCQALPCQPFPLFPMGKQVPLVAHWFSIGCRAYNIAGRARDVSQGYLKFLESMMNSWKVAGARAPSWGSYFQSFMERLPGSHPYSSAQATMTPKDEAKVCVLQ